MGLLTFSINVTLSALEARVERVTARLDELAPLWCHGLPVGGQLALTWPILSASAG